MREIGRQRGKPAEKHQEGKESNRLTTNGCHKKEKKRSEKGNETTTRSLKLGARLLREKGWKKRRKGGRKKKT